MEERGKPRVSETIKHAESSHDSLDLFSAEALAQLTVQSKTIYSPSAIQTVLGVTGNKEEPLQYLSVFLEDFNAFVLKSTSLPSTLVRDAILKTVLLKLRPELQNFSSTSWATWFQQHLSLLRSGTNKTYLGWLGTNISCDSYQAIVKGFNIAYESLSPSNRINIYNSYIKTYLSQQARSTGIACDIQRGMRSWIDVNLGKFIEQSSMHHLVRFNAKFKELGDQSLQDLLGPNFGFHLEAERSEPPSAAPPVTGRATTYRKTHTFQMFYSVLPLCLLNAVL